MKFDEIATDRAVGAILAHPHRVGARGMLKKGHVVTADDVRELGANGVTRVMAARLEPGDVGEDDAAERIAEAIAGRGLTIARAFTGRANVFAATRGVLVVARSQVDALNAIDEAVTVGTVAPYSVLEAGAMAATVKIIPFAVPAALLAGAVAIAERPLLSLAPFTRKRAGLVLTERPGIREGQGARAAENQRLRMAYLGGELVRVVSTAHEAGAVADAIESMLAEALDLVLVLGASAIVDRKDVVPAAIEAVGGVVEHLGMPVDPGNMLLVGRRGATPIIGVPGCARTLKRSGFDWVLERLAADLPVTRAEITRLGVGGVLSEGSATRPAASPREPRAWRRSCSPRRTRSACSRPSTARRSSREWSMRSPPRASPRCSSWSAKMPPRCAER
jgi:molybdenum cofactor cytidylyltransferase